MAYKFRVAICRSLLLAHFLVPAMLQAQEVHYIDLIGVQQRTDLRHPPAPLPDCRAGVPCVFSGVGVGVSIVCGGPDLWDPRALTVQILSVVPDGIDPVQPVEVEFRILNTGTVPLELPVWPHLSDLQQADESQNFSFMSLGLVVNVTIGNAQTAPIPNAPGFVNLLRISGGCQDDAGPGPWRMDPRPIQRHAIGGTA